MKKALIAVIVCVFFIQWSPTNIHALSCEEIPSVEAAYEKYDGIVVGRVDKVTQHGSRNEAQLTVTTSFKGVKTDRISIIEDSTWGALSGPSKIGEVYVFFLKKNGSQWENPLCSPTVKMVDAAEHLEYLNGKEIALQKANTFSMTWLVITFTIVCLIGIILYGL